MLKFLNILTNMKNKETALQTILDQKIVPLFYHDDPQVSLDVTKTLYKAGIRAVEYTNRGPLSLENFKRLKEAAETNMPELQLGAGTIKSWKDARVFLREGADFIVSPVVKMEIKNAAQIADRLWIPGCLTPTEIDTASRSGANLIKIFPAPSPDYISALKPVFPDTLFMPTGGVELRRENLDTWFNKGASAVGIGSSWVSQEILTNKQYEVLFRKTKKALEIVKLLNG